MREYYIRREGDEDSSGPYDLDQISSLMEAGKLDPEAYYYDIEAEQWERISTNQEMMDTLFPKKRKLSLRHQTDEDEGPPILHDEPATPDTAASGEGTEGADGAPPAPKKKIVPPAFKPPAPPVKKQSITVQAMLAQAEGRDEDSGGRSPLEMRSAAAYLALRSLTAFFIASAICLGLIDRELLLGADALQIVKSPYLILAAFDALMVFFLLLQVTAVYPLLRFRAAIGLGLLSVFFYASGDPILLVGNALLMASIYFCTVVMKMQLAVLATAAGVLGLAAYAYSLLTPLI